MPNKEKGKSTKLMKLNEINEEDIILEMETKNIKSKEGKVFHEKRILRADNDKPIFFRPKYKESDGLKGFPRFDKGQQKISYSFSVRLEWEDDREYYDLMRIFEHCKNLAKKEKWQRVQISKSFLQ